MRCSAKATLGVLALLSCLAACGGSGGGIDASPALRIAFPPPNAEIEATEVVVLGTATETEAIGELLVNGVPATTTDGFKTWNATVPVTPGFNALSVRARTSLGTSLDTGLDQLLRRQGGYAVASYGVQTIPARPVFDPIRRRLLFLTPGLPRLQIVAVDVDTGFRSVVWDQDQGSGPLPEGGNTYGTAYDPTRNVFYCGANVATARPILALDLATGNRTEIATANPLDPRNLVYDPVRDRVLVFSVFPLPSIVAIDPVTLTATELSGPNVGSGPPLASNGAGVITYSATSPIVVDPVDDRIVFLTPSLVSQTSIAVLIDPVTGDRTNVPLTTPPNWLGAAYDTANSRIIALVSEPPSPGGRRLVVIDPASATVTPLADLDPPAGIANSVGFPFDPTTGKGYLRTSTGVFSVDIDDGSTEPVSSFAELAQAATDLAWDVAGDRVFVIEPSTTAPRILGYHRSTGAQVFEWIGSNQLPNRPNRIAWDAAGQRLLFWSGDAIVALDPAVGVPVVLSSSSLGIGAGPPISGWLTTLDLAVAPDGSVAYIATSAASTGRLLAVDLVSGERTLVSTFGSQTLILASLAVDPGTGHVLVAESGARRITEIDPATGVATTIFGIGVGSGAAPNSLGTVAVDPSTGLVVFGAPSSREIFTLDRATGIVTLLRSGGGQANFDVVGPRSTLAVANFLGYAAIPGQSGVGIGFLNLESGQYAALPRATN